MLSFGYFHAFHSSVPLLLPHIFAGRAAKLPFEAGREVAEGAEAGQVGYFGDIVFPLLQQLGSAVAVTLKVAAADLASFCEAESAWKVSEGDYQFLIGASSRDIRATLQAGVAASSAEAHPLFAVQGELERLKR